ncbi:MAG: hypothetical protein U9R75_11335, partial [Candidatus Thermoplasmatota archaeon]|nr:hypothetical protein [Candidatus Thermoplasmatota archaeon]
MTRYKLWLALGSGLYNFRVMVDPYHLIDEVNEENNDILYSTTTLASLVAENNILVVDDDGSLDNFIEEDRVMATASGVAIPYPDGEPSQAVIDSLNEMDYYHEVITTETYHDVSEWVPGSGPLVEELKRFNSVIWVTGDSGSIGAIDRETLTDPDIVNIEQYLDGLYDEAEFLGDEHNENLMITGRYVLQDISGGSDHSLPTGSPVTSTHTFLRDYLGVEPEVVSPLQETGRNLFGARDGTFFSETYFGMELRSADLASDEGMQFQPLVKYERKDSTVENAMQSFNTDSQLRTISVQHSHHDPVEGNYFRTIFHSWNLDELVRSGDGTMEHPFQEVTFLSLHWFDFPVDKPEIVSRNLLLTVSDDNPSIGNSYLVKLRLANLGGESGGGTVRFMDGETLFSSRYIFLDPGNEVTIEAIWEPLYAGDRVITVWLDRFDDYDEVFDDLNNMPSKNIHVFFFWDDMESENNDNFEHSTLIAMINGENPLDYYDPTDPEPQTNVMSSWDETMSYGVMEVDDTSNSAPYSFHLEEASGSEDTANVLISFVIDDSAS